VAVIVSKCGDLSSADDMRDAAVEQFIEERRQKALLAIERMKREAPYLAAKENTGGESD
jgi:hypothetical protein